MKTKATLISTLAALATSLHGGTSAPTPISEPASSAPMLGGWFFGGSYGQLNSVDSNGTKLLNNAIDLPGLAEVADFENGGSFKVDGFDFDMFTLHGGRTFGSGFYGFTTSLYLEVGWLRGDSRASYSGPFENVDFDEVDLGEFDLTDEQLEQLETAAAILGDPGIDIDIVPVTLNFMAERNLVGNLGFYVGGGLGYAFTKIDAFGESETGGGFIAQASAGLVYNFTETFEVYGGARWIYLDSLNFGDSDLELDNDFAWEIGLRVNF